jgi:chromate transport protein ChrA
MKNRTLFLLAIPSAVIFAAVGFYYQETGFVQSFAKYYVYGAYENVALSLCMLFLISLMVFRKLFVKPDDKFRWKGVLALVVAFICFALSGIYALLLFLAAGFLYDRFAAQGE